DAQGPAFFTRPNGESLDLHPSVAHLKIDRLSKDVGNERRKTDCQPPETCDEGCDDNAHHDDVADDHGDGRDRHHISTAFRLSTRLQRRPMRASSRCMMGMAFMPSYWSQKPTAKPPPRKNSAPAVPR